jgi:hypothetical protein
MEGFCLTFLSGTGIISIATRLPPARLVQNCRHLAGILVLGVPARLVTIWVRCRVVTGPAKLEGDATVKLPIHSACRKLYFAHELHFLGRKTEAIIYCAVD